MALSFLTSRSVTLRVVLAASWNGLSLLISYTIITQLYNYYSAIDYYAIDHHQIKI
jgi:hypothetical protein